MTPEPTDALVERVRAFIVTGQVKRDFALAALTELAERLKAAEQDAETLSDLADALRAERDGLKEQLEAADAALKWIADNYSAALEAMPVVLYRDLRASSSASEGKRP